MAKQRVYEVARELGLESKQVLERAQELGIDVKTASSGLDEDAVGLIALSYQEERSLTTDPAVAEVDEETVGEDAESMATLQVAEEEVAEDEAVEGEAAAGEITEPGDDERTLLLEEGVTTQELARLIGVRTSDIVKQLMSMGEMVPGGGLIPAHALEPLGSSFGYEILVAETEEAEEEPPVRRHLVQYEDAPASLQPRPPVVTVMGHVDHGKTQLLDTIRRTNVIADEAGGITQHIGAYQVDHEGTTITFIDTPGHEAFTALRARGAEVTDIVVLVVAGDDGVMPQTVEAIDHASAAGVPLIVAINKMDLPAADAYAVRAALTQHGVVVEELGGDVPSVEASALEGTGLDDLLEIIGLVAEVEEIAANPAAPAIGTVIESQLEVGRGPVGTVIVQRGTLKRGDAMVAGPVAGRVRAMFDENGEQPKSAPAIKPSCTSSSRPMPMARSRRFETRLSRSSVPTRRWS